MQSYINFWIICTKILLSLKTSFSACFYSSDEAEVNIPDAQNVTHRYLYTLTRSNFLPLYVKLVAYNYPALLKIKIFDYSNLVRRHS